LFKGAVATPVTLLSPALKLTVMEQLVTVLMLFVRNISQTTIAMKEKAPKRRRDEELSQYP
jgi:hypothetical protein